MSSSTTEASTAKSALSFILDGSRRLHQKQSDRIQGVVAAPFDYDCNKGDDDDDDDDDDERDSQLDHFRASVSSTASSFMSEDDESAAHRFSDDHTRLQFFQQQQQQQQHQHQHQHQQHQHQQQYALASLGSESTPSRSTGLKTSKRRAARPASRTCKFDGCDQYVVDHGLCVRHGGGKRCLSDGCTSRAKHFGRCWRHGGSMECKITGCVNRAKSRGFCWSHGGGTKCKAEPCEKIAISNGLCWAHGGGKRCVVDGCMKQAYERTQNLCNSHFQQWKRGQAAAAATQ